MLIAFSPPVPVFAQTEPSTPTILRGATGLEASDDDRVVAFSVPFDGAARFAIPLELPPGTGGIAPRLSLRYSTLGRASTWVGFGWNLGLGEIRRSLRQGRPAYDDTEDTFELDGEPLVEITPGEYRTRRESFSGFGG